MRRGRGISVRGSVVWGLPFILLCLATAVAAQPCSPGFSSPTGMAPCSACPVGTQAPSPGSTFCTPCPAGTFTPFTGTASCSPCAPGRHAPNPGSTSCFACPAGTHAPSAGSTSCTDCPPGTFQDEAGSATCEDCADGHYQDQSGQTRCISCPPACAPGDACREAGECLVDRGCFNAPRPDGTACDDANACTQTDACAEGACVGSDPVVCLPLDDCHDAGECSPATGECSNPVREDGSTCDDGVVCTGGDVCTAGTCGGAPVPGCCASDVDCDDANACTIGESCDVATGECSPGEPVDCDDGDPCTDDACAPDDGACVNTLVPLDPLSIDSVLCHVGAALGPLGL